MGNVLTCFLILKRSHDSVNQKFNFGNVMSYPSNMIGYKASMTQQNWVGDVTHTLSILYTVIGL